MLNIKEGRSKAMTKLHPDFAEFITNYAKQKENERKAKELAPAVFINLRGGGNLPKRRQLWIPLLATVFWLSIMAVPAIIVIRSGVGFMQ